MISKFRWWLATLIMTAEQKQRVAYGFQMLGEEQQLRRIIALVSFDAGEDEIIQ